MCYITPNPPNAKLERVTMASKRSRTDLTMAKKKEICDYKEKKAKAT
jgi:hypothetical protein